MTESTGAADPTNPAEPARPADPQPTLAAATPATATTTGPSKKLLIAAIVFGLIGIGGVSFTAGYWTSELTGHRGGHGMHQKGPGGHGPQARVGAERHREGARPERMRPPGAAPTTNTSAAPTASAAPSTPVPAPAP